MNWRVVEEGILDGNKKPHANTPFFKRAFPDPEKQHCRKHPRTSPVLPTHSHPTNSHPHTVPHHANSQSLSRPALSLDVPAPLFHTSCIFSGQHRKQRSHKSFLKVEWKRRGTGFGWHLQSLTAILRDLGSSVHSRDDRVASNSEMLEGKHTRGWGPSLSQQGLVVRNTEGPGASTCNIGFSGLIQIRELEKARHGTWTGVSTCVTRRPVKLLIQTETLKVSW